MPIAAVAQRHLGCFFAVFSVEVEKSGVFTLVMEGVVCDSRAWYGLFLSGMTTFFVGWVRWSLAAKVFWHVPQDTVTRLSTSIFWKRA